jgi:hypothetical protein
MIANPCGSRKLITTRNRRMSARVITPLAAHSDDTTHPLLALLGSGHHPAASDNSSGSIRSEAAADGAH